MSSELSSLSETNAFYAETFSGFSAPPPPFLAQPLQRFLKEITPDESMSQRSVLNEVQMQPYAANSSTSVSNTDSGTFPKTDQSTDSVTNVRSSKPPRVSRFSDIVPSSIVSTLSSTDIPVETQLNYTQINENIYCLPSFRRQQKRHNREVMECECTTSEYDRSRGIKACGSECLNRMLLIECGPMCPCGQWCTNRRFQRRSYVTHKLVLFKTEMKGYGIRTCASIPKGRFLVEYVGEVIDMDELARRNKKYKRDGQTHQYVMSLIHGTVIDSTIKGNWARFINHSCEPNCVAEKWLVNGEYRMGLFAKRDLNVGEEIAIDYRFETFGTVDLTNEKCYCGTPTCRGTISLRNNNMNNNLIKRPNRRQSLDDDELIVYLRDDTTNEYIFPKTIDEIRQLIQIMSRTDSENVRSMELDLIRSGSQKQLELARLFLECNGLRVLSSWMKDILVDTNENHDEQQYSDEFKYSLLDFVHNVLPIKDRTTVVKHGLLDLIVNRLKLPSNTTEQLEVDDQKQINNLMNSLLNHLDNPIINKLFHLHATWTSLKERYTIPKRKEPQPSSDPYDHHHHYRHSSKHSQEENHHRHRFNSRSSGPYRRSMDRSIGRRSYVTRENHRTHESQLSKDERRRLIEQQFEDEERARVAAAASINNESPNMQNEPPYKKQRTFDDVESMVATTSSTSEDLSMSHSNQMYWIHQHLSQIPIDYIRSYLASIDQSESQTNDSTKVKTETRLPPPPLPDNEAELSRIIRLPVGWSVAMCPSDSSVYFYNEQTKTTSWTPPVSLPTSWSTTPTDNATGTQSTIDLSPLSSAHVNEQHRSNSDSSSLLLAMKLSKHSHRHHRSHRHSHHHHHHYHHHMSSNNKRKRPLSTDPTATNQDDSQSHITEEKFNENFEQTQNNDGHVEIFQENIGNIDVKTADDGENGIDPSSTVIKVSDTNADFSEQTTANNNDDHHNTLSSSSKINRDQLRRNISQHVHATLKPYTKRTCKQGRIISTDDIKYLVKKFTLAVLEKEIEKARNDGVSLSPVLTDRVRLKTEVYVKKYMNKVGTVFQRHNTIVNNLPAHSSQPTVQLSPIATTTINTE